jgi:hypothetical protein
MKTRIVSASKMAEWSVLTNFFRRKGTKPILQVTVLYLLKS